MCAMEESSRRTIWLRDDDLMAHDVPGHPERPARIRALEAEMSAHEWFGASRVQAPEVDAFRARVVHPESHVAFLEKLSAQGGGAIDMDTVRRAGDLRRGAAGGGRRRRRWSTRCSAATPTSA